MNEVSLLSIVELFRIKSTSKCTNTLMPVYIIAFLGVTFVIPVPSISPPPCQKKNKKIRLSVTTFLNILKIIKNLVTQLYIYPVLYFLNVYLHP